MKKLLLALAFVSVVAFLSQRSVAQTERKYLQTTLPEAKGRLSVYADSIDKEWTLSTTHFKGSVAATIWPDGKGYSAYATVLHADEIDLNEKNGELSARGNVRLTMEPRK